MGGDGEKRHVVDDDLGSRGASEQLLLLLLLVPFVLSDLLALSLLLLTLAEPQREQ